MASKVSYSGELYGRVICKKFTEIFVNVDNRSKKFLLIVFLICTNFARHNFSLSLFLSILY